MLIGKPPDIPSSEITPRDAYLRYLSRRRFLKSAPPQLAPQLLGANRLAQLVSPRTCASPEPSSRPFKARSPPPANSSPPSTTSPTTTTSTSSASTKPTRQKCRRLPTRPWTVKVEGKVAKPLTFDIEDLLKLHPLEDRVYRHRCVEAWSMVIPWVGYSLSEFIKQCNPLPCAKYVQFLSYYDRRVEKWAYEDAPSTGPTPKACAWMRP